MAAQIINKVANSQLITIDLEDFYPKGNRIVFDIKDWLYEELILREKDFREQVKNHNWSQYQGDYIALSCSVEAIIPSWAYLLLTTKLTEFAKKVVVGNLELLETVLFNDIITNLNITEYQDKRLIIKGCSNKPIPQSAYTLLVSKIQPICKSIMFGEACSTVPLFKKK
ncbi:DUF2480 family protein [Tenacibaculum finnmarkense]|uniref:DUF2480 family protein n=1 Tax=Tenacibaculum finnmarkense genomovar ulcerans TaxID=2781388 RepID=A0A2I2M6P0_9FLAO|nr:DUF2480 family protein [Tenacibaculum finnmarkense]MBE7696521.1 DUF2480 family protein [Tenacibaculum finnmarkense genomovar ulcerans]MCD8431708.1 DUF2480 family protein [Tenacibaculum finnmarkense genomovar ulcerans]MCG8235014.1 DUF2480 family protein [Tenacibaculum finnmarkense genomovar ulcerans]MCG8733023.1 DUF2480 family protein [Tenacibaculum finnmarkense]MCG8748200.1 DUF2480 family protein [Tenacibaculum finnmarkense]